MLTVIARDHSAIYTLQSILTACPRHQVYLVRADNNTDALLDKYVKQRWFAGIGELDNPTLENLYHHTREKGYTGMGICLEGGVLVQRDPYEVMPPFERATEHSVIYASRYIYDRFSQLGKEAYRSLGIDLEADPSCNRNTHFQAIHYSRPLDPENCLLLPRSSCVGYDPLIGDYFGGREVLRHSVFAEEAAVMDFYPQAIKDAQETIYCYGAPLERYLDVARSIQSYLPPGELEAIERNARKSAFIAPLRTTIRHATGA